MTPCKFLGHNVPTWPGIVTACPLPPWKWKNWKSGPTTLLSKYNFCLLIKFGLHVKILALYFYGFATNHFEVSIWVICLNTNFKTSNLCPNDQAYNCLIHFSSSSCIIHQASCIMHHVSCIIHHASSIIHHASCIMHHALCIMHCALCIMHYASCTR